MGFSAGGGITALLAARLWPDAVEAKRKKKKKKKKKKQIVVPNVDLIAPDMTGDKEVAPVIGDLAGAGSATFSITSDGQICGQFVVESFSDENDPIQLIHIHRGSAVENGPVVIDFTPFLATLGGCVSASRALLREIALNPGAFYANLHTEDFPGGAFRDQLQVDQS
jgi:hypothetical protein